MVDRVTKFGVLIRIDDVSWIVKGLEHKCQVAIEGKDIVITQ